MCWLSVTTCYPVIFLWTRVWESEQEIQLRRNRNPHHPAQETDGLDEACEAWCVQVEANPAPFIGSRVWLHIPFIYPSYTLLITLALFFFFKWWDKIVQCLTAAGYSGVMPGYSPGGASLSLDKRALCREIAWRLAKDPKVGHVVVSLRLFGLGSSIVEGGGRVVGKSSWMLCVDSATIPSGHRMSGYLKSSVRWILRACQGHFRYHDFPMASDPRTQELGRTEPFWVTFPSHCISWDSIPSGQTLPNS